MTELLDIDFLGDERLRARLTRWSLVLLACGLVATFAVAPLLTSGVALHLLTALALLAGVTLVSLPVHELVHALFFRLLGGRGVHVRFGHADGMLYAGCPGLVLTRGRFLVVLLAPTVVLTVALVLIGMVFDLLFIALLAASFHLSGCAGDLLAAWIVARESACTHCQDTEVGVRLLAAKA